MFVRSPDRPNAVLLTTFYRTHRLARIHLLSRGACSTVRVKTGLANIGKNGKSATADRIVGHGPILNLEPKRSRDMLLGWRDVWAGIAQAIPAVVILFIEKLI